MKKFLAVLVAATFTAMSYAAVAQDKMEKAEKTEKKAEKKPAKKTSTKKAAPKKTAKKPAKKSENGMEKK